MQEKEDKGRVEIELQKRYALKAGVFIVFYLGHIGIEKCVD